MPTSFGEPMIRLRAVPIEDNGEPLVDPRTLSQRVFLSDHPKFDELPHLPLVRQRVAEMLAEAADALPAGIAFAIIEGVRPINQQRSMYETVKAEFAAKHPEWNRATLHRVTNRLCAPPDDKCPPPHTTGAAVDLILVNSDSGDWLDMVSPFEMGESSATTKMPGLSKIAQANRELLVKSLSATGLTNYVGEWWHWSYGDSGWALRTGAPKAIYGRLPDFNLEVNLRTYYLR